MKPNDPPQTARNNNKQSDKNTAIKLANQYAERYQLLQKENDSLLTQINDLKVNLQFNKDIVNNFLNNSKMSSKDKVVIEKMEKEINDIRLEKEKLINKNLELENKINDLNQQLQLTKNEIEENKNQIFLLEQSNLEKDNTLIAIKRKTFKSQKIFAEPSKALLKLNDELITYKEIYEKISGYVQKNSQKLQTYEELISDLQNENSKLRTEKRLQIYNSKKEKENLIYKIKKEMQLNSKANNANTNTNGSTYSNNYNCESGANTNRIENRLMSNLYKDNIRDRGSMSGSEKNSNRFEPNFKNYLDDDVIDEDESSKKEKDFNQLMYENEEFADLIRSAGISVHNFIAMSKHRLYAKLTDAVEIMFKAILDRNKSISLLEMENDELNMKNYDLNQENMMLYEKNKKLSNNENADDINTNLYECKKDSKDLINSNSNNFNNKTSTTLTKNQNNEINELIDTNNININNLNINSNSNLNNNLNNNINNIGYNKNQIQTLASVTSQEFKNECQNLDSFMSVEDNKL